MYHLIIRAHSPPLFRKRNCSASVPLNSLDFSECSSCTPSYRELPSACQSYCSAKGELEKSVLNDKWVSVPHYSVDTDQFKHMQQNYAEMRLFELEENYFEVLNYHPHF